MNMSRKIFSVMIAIGTICILAANVLAIPLNGEYSIEVNTTQLDEDSYIFQYSVTNNNQQVGSTMTGLDGFYIQVPESAIISNVTVPASYNGEPGLWSHNSSASFNILNTPEATLEEGNMWLGWWGHHDASVYPIGATAVFSFQADGVTLGSASAAQVSYWWYHEPLAPYVTIDPYGHYTGYSTDLISPVAISEQAVPEPSTMLLLGAGLVGIVAFVKKKK